MIYRFVSKRTTILPLTATDIADLRNQFKIKSLITFIAVPIT